jgi:hypothetical protein
MLVMSAVVSVLGCAPLIPPTGAIPHCGEPGGESHCPPTQPDHSAASRELDGRLRKLADECRAPHLDAPVNFHVTVQVRKNGEVVRATVKTGGHGELAPAAKACLEAPLASMKLDEDAEADFDEIIVLPDERAKKRTLDAVNAAFRAAVARCKHAEFVQGSVWLYGDSIEPGDLEIPETLPADIAACIRREFKLTRLPVDPLRQWGWVSVYSQDLDEP